MARVLVGAILPQRCFCWEKFWSQAFRSRRPIVSNTSGVPFVVYPTRNPGIPKCTEPTDSSTSSLHSHLTKSCSIGLTEGKKIYIYILFFNSLKHTNKTWFCFCLSKGPSRAQACDSLKCVFKTEISRPRSTREGSGDWKIKISS